MTAELVLNELSLDHAPAVEPARDWMFTLIRTCFLAQTAGASRMLLLPEDAVQQELSDGYSIWHWANDPLVDIDLRRKFLSMATYGPFTEKVLGPEALERLGVSEYFHDERSAKGLSAAHVLDALAVSIPSGDTWDQETVEVRILSLDDAADRVQAKIRVAQEEKIPYMLVVGGKDQEAGTVSVRERSAGDLGAMPKDAFVAQALEEAATHGEKTVTVG